MFVVCQNVCVRRAKFQDRLTIRVSKSRASHTDEEGGGENKVKPNNTFSARDETSLEIWSLIARLSETKATKSIKRWLDCPFIVHLHLRL